MFKNIVRVLGGDPNKREIEKLVEQVDRINDMETDLESLTDAQLAGKTAEFQQRLADGETLDELLPEAFATVREASKRTLGMRPYDVQLIGGMVLHQGKIAEMRTGEGKTLVATLPIYLNALTGKGVHLVTVNDYLARRDARWMAPIYHLLGMSVGVLQMAARTENARNAFLVDLEKTSPHEDQHQLNLVLRKEAYSADITYGTNNEFGFDYLRDNLAMSLAARVQRGHTYAIIDEVDNILIDEARTPLIISGPASEDTEWYGRMAQVVRQLRAEDYEMNEKDRNVLLTEAGEARVEDLLDMPMRDPDRPEDISPEQARMLGYLEQALRAQFLYKRNKDYLVQGGKVVIVDEFTGRLMPGRRWSEGLHQAVEAKEGVKVQPENITYATITLQNYFRMYSKLSGMTGTALTEAEEFDKIYKLAVLPIPTNLEYQAQQADSGLNEITSKDKDGYPVTFYAREDDPQRVPVYWKRKDFPDVVFRSEEGKIRALTEEVVRLHVMGRPILVGTTSVEHSDRLARRMDPEPIRRLLQTILLRRTWMARHNIEYMTRVEPDLEVLSKPLTELNPGDLRPLTKSLELSLNPEDSENLAALAGFLDIPATHHPRLLAVIRGGVPRQVLNARVHDQEAQIILKAGEFGAVTIATNMAGRGVDIKLGGEISEEMGEVANRVLRRAGYDPYNLTDLARQELLQQLESEQYYIYEDIVKAFIENVNQMAQVRALGGLHVIGSERHEARRIDNQLRGRAARQGDPGSSRFYLSLQDDLMRLFGGAQVEGIWSRVMVDESQPIEMNLLGRLVEQSQQRVEGANFDVRKHLLEYDDVLNTQRQRIYDQRDRVFTKPDLTEDVLEMLRIELEQRIPQSLKDAEGPWRLLAYLEEIQPSFTFTGGGYPSYAYRLLFEELRRQVGSSNQNDLLIEKLTSLAGIAIEAENQHTLLAFESAFERTGASLQNQRDELTEMLDNYWDTIGEVDEENGMRRPVDVMNELGELLRTQLQLTPEQQRAMMEGDPEVRDVILQQAHASLAETAANRVSGIIRRRLGDQQALRQIDSLPDTWETLVDERMTLIESILTNRQNTLAGENGEIRRDLEAALGKQAFVQPNDHNLIQMFGMMAQGSKLAFDPRTHRRATQRYQRMQFIHAAARLLQDQPVEETTQNVLEHLRNALKVMELARGQMELARLTQVGSRLDELDGRTRQWLSEVLGAEKFLSIQSQAIAEIPVQERESILRVLGRRMQNEAYRATLVRSISNQWIDYLTQMEALRVSIGLEAYGQRDPLVQYKSRATDLFKELLGNIRLDVIGNLFRVQSGALPTQAGTQPAGSAIPAQAAAGGPANQAQPRPSGKKKRRRH